MAVTTTPQDILNMAYPKSTDFVPGQIASESTELLDLVGRSLRGLYALGARINPLVFATSATEAAPGASTPWPWPDDVEAFLRIENDTAGGEVVVVPFDDRDAEEGLAAVYYLGRNFYEAGNANDPDPSTDDLKYWYSKRPAIPATVSTALDSSWLETFNELLALEVAIYLALKMGKGDLAGALRTDRDDELKLYVAHLEHVVPFERRRRGHLRIINTNAMIPLNRLVAGGTDAL